MGDGMQWWARTRGQLARSMHRIESPVEALLVVAIASLKGRFNYDPQAEIEIGRTTFRVDVAVFPREPDQCWPVVVVEVDGHEFHERTKQQAQRDKSRDRALTAAGYTVVRFTGSEVWRNPVSCAEEVLRLYEAKLDGNEQPEQRPQPSSADEEKRELMRRLEEAEQIADEAARHDAVDQVLQELGDRSRRRLGRGSGERDA